MVRSSFHVFPYPDRAPGSRPDGGEATEATPEPGPKPAQTRRFVAQRIERRPGG